MSTLIIGGGVMGCAAAYQLARAGERVTLLERFALGHANGSSHGVSRVIRYNYEGDDYVALARAAYPAWRALEREAGEPLLLPTGGLDMGEPDALAGMRASLQREGIAHDYIDRDEIVRRSPMLNPPEGTVGIYQNDYGVLRADRCVAAMARLAREAGAQIVEHAGVTRVSASTLGVEAATRDSVYRADRMILSAGAWMRGLLRQLGLELPLSVMKETNLYYRPADPAPFMPGRFPLMLQRFKGNHVIGCAFPLVGHAGVKMILDRHGPLIDPDLDDHQADLSQAALIKAYRRDILPGLGEHVIDVATCRYTLTPDEDFVVDAHPEHKQVIIGSPCSGHGFKFGIVLGQMLADLALQGRTTLPGRHLFRLDRPGLAPGRAWHL